MGCHYLLQGIFLIQGLNPHLLHCKWVLLPLCHQRSLPKILFRYSLIIETLIFYGNLPGALCPPTPSQLDSSQSWMFIWHLDFHLIGSHLRSIFLLNLIFWFKAWLCWISFTNFLRKKYVSELFSECLQAWECMFNPTNDWYFGYI